MLMIISSRALSKLPYDQALPFNSRDLLIMVNSDIGFRLRNVCNEVGGVFNISDVYEKNEKVFGKVPLNERAKKFLPHLKSSLERYFITKKDEYIFFDTREQSFIRKTMSAAGLSCSVDVFMLNEDNVFEIIDYRELKGKESKKVVRFLSDCAVREVINCMDYYDSRRFAGQAGFKRGFKSSIKFDDDIFEEYSRYSKLKLIKSKESFNKYMKALRVKYHPDKCKDDNAEEISKVISQDIEKLKATSWFENLPDKNPVTPKDEDVPKEESISSEDTSKDKDAKGEDTAESNKEEVKSK